MQRIKHRAQFQAVMAAPAVARTPHFALHRLALDAPVEESTGPGSPKPQALFAVRAPWFGTVLPKRWAKRAVTRNTIRRQVFAVAEEVAGGLAPAALVVRLRAGFGREQFRSATSELLRRAVRAELQHLFSKAARC